MATTMIVIIMTMTTTIIITMKVQVQPGVYPVTHRPPPESRVQMTFEYSNSISQCGSDLLATILGRQRPSTLLPSPHPPPPTPP